MLAAGQIIVDHGALLVRQRDRLLEPQAVGVQGVPPEPVGRALENLVAAQGELTPAAFHQEFATIHPVVDGNGRVGALRYNWLSGALAAPNTAPEYEAR